MTAASGSRKPKRTRALAAPRMADLSFLGAPPLIPGELAEDYERLLADLTNAMKPIDVMESIWTRDIVDLQWDIMRFRRIKADLIDLKREHLIEQVCVQEILPPEVPEPDSLGG